MAMKLLTELTDRHIKCFGARHKQIRDNRTVTALSGIILEI